MNVAGRYAKSIFELALEKDQMSVIADDMRVVLETVKGSPELQTMLESPLVSKKAKLDSLNKIFVKCDELTQNLMRVMTSKNREDILVQVAQSFMALKNAHEGITEVELTTAKVVNLADLGGIEAYVKSQTNAKTVNISTNVDERLMGGFKISFEGKMYDSTISTQLNKFKKELKLS